MSKVKDKEMQLQMYKVEIALCYWFFPVHFEYIDVSQNQEMNGMNIRNQIYIQSVKISKF